jgi:hypothetical protein
MFPYSPPQSNALWSHETTTDVATSNKLLSESGSFLGAEGMTWLRASDDVHHLCATTSPSQNDEHVGFTAVPLSGPAPQRFYSTRQLPSEKTIGPRELSYELRGDGDSGRLSVRSLSFDEERDVPLENDLHDIYSTQAYNAQNFYSLVITADANAQPRHKRKRASQLFKRLAGLGMRRKEHDFEKRLDRPMVAAV